jgi:hypothetical protein
VRDIENFSQNKMDGLDHLEGIIIDSLLYSKQPANGPYKEQFESIPPHNIKALGPVIEVSPI